MRNYIIVSLLFLVLISGCSMIQDTDNYGQLELILVFQEEEVVNSGAKGFVDFSRETEAAFNRIHCTVQNGATIHFDQDLNLVGGFFEANIDLEANSGYEVRLQCFINNQLAFDGLKQNITITAGETNTETITLQVTEPMGPDGLNETSVTSSQAALAWNDNSINEEGFRIVRRDAGVGSFAEVGNVSVDVTAFADNTVTASTSYDYKVLAFNSRGFAESNQITVSVPASGGNTPNPPSNLQANAVSSNQIHLNWTDNSTNENGFRIERREGVGGTYFQIFETGADVSNYSDNGVNPSTQYFYRVRAFNGDGNSGYTSEANATTPASGSGDINVPGDYPNIQAGIDAASDGEVVVVADGTWMGSDNKNISFSGKNITLRSANGANNCIIDCEGTGRGFIFNSGESDQAVLDGFKIINGDVTGATQDGGGMYLSNSDPTIQNCIIQNCDADGGGGIMIAGTASPTFNNCIIDGNTAATYGGGVQTSGSSDPSFIDCNITNNEAWNGGGLDIFQGGGLVQDCIITGNYASNKGAGLYIKDCSPTITGGTIDNNDADEEGGGIYTYNTTALTIEDVTVSNNSSGYFGGGIAIDASSADINDCIIIGNYSGTDGGGIAYQNADGNIAGCDIYGNSSFTNGGGIALLSSSPLIEYCDLDGNSTNYGGGVYLDNSSPTIRYCEFWDNTVTTGGGGINSTNNSSPIVIGSLFSENTSSSGGGGITLYNSPNSQIKRCTFSENEADVNGGSVLILNSNNAIVKNNIFAQSIGNSALHIDNTTNAVIDYNDFWQSSNEHFSGTFPPNLGTISNTNYNGDDCDDFYNIFEAPIFVDPGNGDYYLQGNSPCIDAGDPASGNDPDGTIADQGAFYFDQTE